MFFVLLIGLVLFIGISAAGFYLTRQQLKQKAANLSTLKADVDAVDDSITDAKNVISQYEELSFIDDIASDVLPPNKVQSDLVEEIYTLANEAGITIRTINFVSPGGTPTTDPSLTQTVQLEGIPGVYSLPTSVSYEASNYNQFVNFLEKLEENRRKLQISRLGINPVRETIQGGGNSTFVSGYQGTLELNVYVRPGS
jgi:Tfp pilus assembly protein PilO